MQGTSVAAPEVSFIVTFRKESHDVQVPSSTTVHQLKQLLENITGVPVGNQKLIVKGMVRDEMQLAETNIKNGARVMLMGTPQAEIDKMNAAKPPPTEKLSSRPVAPYRYMRGGVNTIDGLGKVNCFGSIKVLDGWPNATQARQILQKLSVDPSIVAVMRKHNWHVNLLSELSPHHHTLLGFNLNRGAEISLRLRFENGFRQYASIKRVLYHELAHMEVDEHDNKFKELNSQIRRECEAIGPGRKVDERNARHQPEEHEEDEADHVDQGGLGHRLGGDEISSSSVGLSPAHAAGDAAQRRLLTTHNTPSLSYSNNAIPISPLVLSPLTPSPAIDSPGGTPIPNSPNPFKQAPTKQISPLGMVQSSEPTRLALSSSLTSSSASSSSPIIVSERLIPIPSTVITTAGSRFSPPPDNNNNNSNNKEKHKEQQHDTDNNTNSNGAPATMVESCPVCQAAFPASTTDKDVTQHVNACLDRTS